MRCVTLFTANSPLTRSRLGSTPLLLTSLVGLVERAWRHARLTLSLALAFALALFALPSTPHTSPHPSPHPSPLHSLAPLHLRHAAAHDPSASLASPTDAAFLAAESAAEAIWSLSFSHAHNHAALIDAGAIEALAGMVSARDLLGIRTPPRAAMWAAAALQNLAASYCETADGRCVWRCAHSTPPQPHLTAPQPPA